MSLRTNRIATSTLWLIALSGVSSIVSGADTKPIVRETCAQVAGATHRQACRKPLILASYTDARGGQALVRGRTGVAVELLNTRKFARLSAAELTNLCVARTVLRQWSQAGEACDAAVARTLAERASMSRWPGAYRKAVDKAAGAAYSNRAVMHWLSGNQLAAHEDLVQAQNLSPDASYVMRNLEVAERNPSLVRATADPSPIG
jgi:hypothetical protein